MTVKRILGYPGFAVEYTPESDPYFECIVCGALAEIRKLTAGQKLLAAIAGVNPGVRGDGSNGFARGVNITIHPLETKVNIVHKGVQYPTNTSDRATNMQNEVLNWNLAQDFKRAGTNTLRRGGGNSHMAADSPASGNGTGSVAKVHFTNAIRTMDSGLEAPPFVGLAHELIHALHSLKGEKKANTNEEESRTVGMNEYADEALSENAIRAEAKLTLRTKY
jgi:Effector protein